MQAGEEHAGRVYLISTFVLLEDIWNKKEKVQEELKEQKNGLGRETGRGELHSFYQPEVRRTPGGCSAWGGQQSLLRDPQGK